MTPKVGWGMLRMKSRESLPINEQEVLRLQNI